MLTKASFTRVSHLVCFEENTDDIHQLTRILTEKEYSAPQILNPLKSHSVYNAYLHLISKRIRQ